MVIVKVQLENFCGSNVALGQDDWIHEIAGQRGRMNEPRSLAKKSNLSVQEDVDVAKRRAIDIDVQGLVGGFCRRQPVVLGQVQLLRTLESQQLSRPQDFRVQQHLDGAGPGRVRAGNRLFESPGKPNNTSDNPYRATKRRDANENLVDPREV